MTPPIEQRIAALPPVAPVWDEARKFWLYKGAYGLKEVQFHEYHLDCLRLLTDAVREYLNAVDTAKDYVTWLSTKMRAEADLRAVVKAML